MRTGRRMICLGISSAVFLLARHLRSNLSRKGLMLDAGRQQTKGGCTMSHKAKILAIDAGGTMTASFIIDEKGEFIVGKAQTTPHDESIGFANSCRDALKYWNMTPEEAFPTIVSGIYSGTAMLNRLLERKGKRLGLIVTAGQEDYLRLERGIQTYLGY